jgi:hypothetical protein
VSGISILNREFLPRFSPTMQGIFGSFPTIGLIPICMLASTTLVYSQFNQNYTSDVTYQHESSKVCWETRLNKTEINVLIDFRISEPNLKTIKLKQVWIFPSWIKDENGRQFKDVRTDIEKITNETTSVAYSMFENHELVKGKWKFQLYYKKKLLHEMEFIVP